MEKCPFCSVALDREAAAAAAEIQERVNQACSEASYLRIAAITMFVFIGLSFLPFIPGFWGFLITFVVVTVLIIRWQLRYGSLITNDSDYVKARRQKNLALILWLVAIPVVILKLLQIASIFASPE